MEEKLKGSYRFAWKLKGHYFAIELADICPFNSPLTSFKLPFNFKKKTTIKQIITIMKKETWKLIVQILISILTALGTTLGVASCM